MAYFSIVHHLTNLYVEEHAAVEAYTLGGPLAGTFWFGHIVTGVVLPVMLLRRSIKSADVSSALTPMVVSCMATIIGGLALVYVIVVGSQETPQRLFPGQIVVDSRFGDASSANYFPSMWEVGLGLGGCALALFLVLMAMRVLPFVPALESGEHRPTHSGDADD